MTTVQSIHETIAQAGATPDRDLRVIRDAKVGDHCRQGDVYLLRIEKRPACFKTQTKVRQLAPGTSKGSRHVATGNLKVYIANENEAREAIARFPGVTGGRMLLAGPVIESEDRWTLEHPEHACHSLPAGTWQVLYQLDPRSMRRVQD